MSEGCEKQKNATLDYSGSTNSVECLMIKFFKRLREFQIIVKKLALPNLNMINNKSRSILIRFNLTWLIANCIKNFIRNMNVK